MEIPKLVAFRDEPLPKTMIGKLSRKDIVEQECIHLVESLDDWQFL